MAFHLKSISVDSTTVLCAKPVYSHSGVGFEWNATDKSDKQRSYRPIIVFRLWGLASIRFILPVLETPP